MISILRMRLHKWLAIYAALLPLSASALNMAEFPLRGGAGPATTVTGADGNIWFAASLGNYIGQMTPQGALLNEFSRGMSPLCGPDRIVMGPDGNLWFTELLCNKIGRITPQGVITEFTTGITQGFPGGKPFGITAGNDGNLWFTESGTGNIGRITPQGVVTQFRVDTAEKMPTDIVEGPDGNLWFTERFGRRIGRMSKAGSVTYFNSKAPFGAMLVNINVGPDGNLWYTELFGSTTTSFGTGAIGRITTAGVATRFTKGLTFPGGPVSITTGPDGNMWFVEYFGSRVGKITTSGVITEFQALAPLVVPDGISVGPDHNLWFTEVLGSRIVRATDLL